VTDEFDMSMISTPPQALPRFDVNLEPPDIDDWIAGNTGVRGFTTRSSGKPGPHVALISLLHGNEFAGAIVLQRLLRDGLRPQRGKLTCGFANLAAFARFDPRQPTASRFIDEDMNRLWDNDVLDGVRRSSELDRAREIRPIIDTVDTLLDLHTMLWPSDPLMLCGPSERGRALAQGIGQPVLVVSDIGHVSGRRLVDYARFVDPDSFGAANLVEAGQHWEDEAVQMSLACVAGILRHTGLIDDFAGLPPPPAPPPAQRMAEVTRTVTATTANFTFVRPFRGGDVIAERNTLIALDGQSEIRTPHDECLLVMPSLRPSRGHTAVRLAAFRD
jgi:predicted deacylase